MQSARGSPTRSRRRWYNYGHLDIVFDDGSVGWYEAGWGPMMSETAFFVKDMIGPKGVGVDRRQSGRRQGVASSDHDAHTRTNALRIHHAALDAKGGFVTPDTIESRPRTSPATRSSASASSGSSSRRSAARSTFPTIGPTRSIRSASSSPPTKACAPARSCGCRRRVTPTAEEGYRSRPETRRGR